MNVIKSEWIKLTTTKSVWWTSALILFFSVAFAMLNGWGTGMMLRDMSDIPVEAQAHIAEGATVEGGVAGMTLFGTMIIIIQSVINVTNEYGSGTAKSTLLATPKRTMVPIAKWLDYGAIAAVLTFVASAISIWANHWVLGLMNVDQAIVDKARFGAENTWPVIGRMVLYSVLLVMIATGVAYLLRSTAAGIALLLLWRLVMEGLIVPLVPWVRDHLPQYMPFYNMDNYVAMQDTVDAPWGQSGSMLYFLVVCAVIFIAGIVVLKNRDA